MEVFNRVKNCTVEELENDLLEARATFMDSVHEINLTVRASRQTMEIVWARADMVRVPHPQCVTAGEKDQNLVGIRIGAGSRKAVQKAVGHSYGCTHLTDLAMDVVRALLGVDYELRERGLTEEEIEANYINLLGGTCNRWTDKTEKSMSSGSDQ